MSILDVLGGAGSGAITGGMLGGPYGALAGGVLGGGMGLLSGNARENAASSQKKSIDDAMARLRASSQQQYAGRMQDLDKAMSFYGPARNALLAYGQPTPQLAPPPGMGSFDTSMYRREPGAKVG